MNALERYIVEEHIEDFNDGLIGRRELLRRVALVTGGVAGAASLLELMGCGLQPAGSPASPSGRTSSQPVGFATPPAHPTTTGVTVQPDDPRIRVQSLPVTGADGAALISYHAQPAGASQAPGILVVHENRGLVEHIRDVVRRVATAGFQGLSVDLLSRQGGADKLSDPAAYAAALVKQPVSDMVSDLQRALSALSASSAGGAGQRLGITGFCFGGGMVWNTLAAGAVVKAAVPFYGPPPQNMAGLAHTRAAVYAIYAQLDRRITSSRTQIETELKQAGQPYQIMVYPGVDHAFHNDTGARYNATQAEAAWVATIDWFRKYV